MYSYIIDKYSHEYKTRRILDLDKILLGSCVFLSFFIDVVGLLLLFTIFVFASVVHFAFLLRSALLWPHSYVVGFRFWFHHVFWGGTELFLLLFCCSSVFVTAVFQIFLVLLCIVFHFIVIFFSLLLSIAYFVLVLFDGGFQPYVNVFVSVSSLFDIVCLISLLLLLCWCCLLVFTVVHVCGCWYSVILLCAIVLCLILLVVEVCCCSYADGLHFISFFKCLCLFVLFHCCCMFVTAVVDGCCCSYCIFLGISLCDIFVLLFLVFSFVGTFFFFLITLVLVVVCSWIVFISCMSSVVLVVLSLFHC